MKKILTILSLATFLAFAGCHTNTSVNTNANMNLNANYNMNMATPVMKTNESAMTDPVLKAKIEDALKKKGFTDVTVDTTMTPAMLRGTVAKGKMAEAVQTAQEAAGKPLKSEITEK